MQIISGAEAHRRLTSPDNIINKIDQSRSAPTPVGIVDEVVEQNETDQTNEESQSSHPQEKAILSGLNRPSDSPLSSTHEELLNGVLEMVDENGKLPAKYRGQRGKQMPDVLRAMIGIEAHYDKPKNLTEEYGVNPSQVSNYKHGKVGGKPDEDLQKTIESELDKVRRVAKRKLMQAMKLIDTDSMAGLNAVELSNVAKSMSTIVQQSIPAHMKEAAKDENDKRPQFIVMVPPVHEESKYKQIEVGG